ncbi:MAG: hypothetical protein M5R41_15640 [Bacteroidia bacterium]|nr:hypothetical protein [Bacteroidia bacterium]
MRRIATLLILLLRAVSLSAAEPDTLASYRNVLMVSIGYQHSPLTEFNDGIAPSGFDAVSATNLTGGFEWAFINAPKHMQSISLEFTLAKELERAEPLQPAREFQVRSMAGYLNSGLPVYNDGFHRLLFRLDLGVGLTVLSSALKQNFQDVLDGLPAERNTISQSSLLLRLGFRHEFRFDSDAESPFPIGIRVGYAFTLTTNDWTNADAFGASGMQISGGPKAQYTGFSAALDLPLAVFR